MDLPHLAKRAFRDQIGPNVQKAMLLGSPSHQGLKIADFLKNISVLSSGLLPHTRSKTLKTTVF